MSAVPTMTEAVLAREARCPSASRATQRFEWTMVALSAALVTGAHLDSWAHGHVIATLETFFTPWHAVLYGSLAATAAFLALTAAWTGARLADWRYALPDGYALSLAGCVTFAIGGLLDLGWHLAFGIERNFQALISPTHLVLIASGGLVVSGPLRAAWRRPGRGIGWPAIVSATLTLTMLTFFMQFDHPFTSQWMAAPQPPVPAQPAEELGILGIIVQAALLGGMLTLLLRRFDLPLGSLTFVMGVNAAFVTMIQGADPVILVGVLGGVAADILRAVLNPTPSRVRQFRLFAFSVPALTYALYTAGILWADGVWWPVHLWAGAPVVAGLAGLVLSLAVLPPATPETGEAA